MNRRGFIGGLITALAAPAIIRTPGLLMPVRPLLQDDFSIDDVRWETSERLPVFHFLGLPPLRREGGLFAFDSGADGIRYSPFVGRHDNRTDLLHTVRAALKDRDETPRTSV
jgi:hypothetical protein